MHIENRSVNLDATDTVKMDDRTFSGLIVPWDNIVEVAPGVREQFKRGSVRIDPDQPPMLFRDHLVPIGKIANIDDRDDGLYITARISETPSGDETLTLIRDGILDRMSIGFQPIAADNTQDSDGILITRTDTIIREASVVPFPAYPSAKIIDHRHLQEDLMSSTAPENATRADLEDLATRADLEEISRRVDSLRVTSHAAAADTRSAGQVLKDIISGDTATIESANRWQNREYQGATLADIPAQIPSGIENLVHIIDTSNPVASLFKTAALPAHGMSVSFLQIKNSQIKVGKQAAVGADLPGPSKVAFEVKSSPIEVHGGWTELDLVSVQRMEVPELDTVLQAMAVEIGKARAKSVVDTLTSTITEQAKKQEISIPAPNSADAWSDVIVDAQIAYLNTGIPLDGLLVAPNLFKVLRKMKDGKGGYVMNTFGDGVNNLGVIDGLSGQLGPIRVALFPGASDNTAAFYAKDAISIRTNHMVQLQDTNVINLSGQWSLHQLSAVCVERPDLILPVTQPSSSPAAA